MGDTTGDDLHEDVMGATMETLAEHGFADLTMREVAKRTEASKSTLHYRYGSKDGLLATVIDELNDNVESLFRSFDGEPPLDRLVGVLETNLELLEDPVHPGLNEAYIEMHARASRNEAFREAIGAGHELYREELAAIIEDGIEEGVFSDVDPWATATLLMAVPDSAGLHTATLGNEDAIDELRTAVNEVVLESLLAEHVDVDSGDLL